MHNGLVRRIRDQPGGRGIFEGTARDPACNTGHRPERFIAVIGGGIPPVCEGPAGILSTMAPAPPAGRSPVFDPALVRRTVREGRDSCYCEDREWRTERLQLEKSDMGSEVATPGDVLRSVEDTSELWLTTGLNTQE